MDSKVPSPQSNPNYDNESIISYIESMYLYCVSCFFNKIFTFQKNICVCVEEGAVLEMLGGKNGVIDTRARTHILNEGAVREPIEGEDSENSIIECDCGMCVFQLW